MVIGFTGDVMLGRLVNEKIKQTSFTYPWGNVLSLLQKMDLTLINLETSITQHNIPVPKVFNFKTDPSTIKTLLAANIDVVSLANNHILDFGNEGLFDTLEILKKADIAYVGAGKNLQEAQEAAIITKNNITLGIIGFTDNEPGWIATKNKPGINYIKVGDIETVKKQVDAIRNKVDCVVATIHWGPNMRERPNKEFITFAHQMIDAGIDIIHGHSAHIFQGIEIYKNKLIMYDTGDFVDDYMVDPQLRNDISFLFQVTLEKNNLKTVTLTPVAINNMQVNLATDKNYNWAMQRMKMLCQEFGTQITDNIITIQ